MKNRQKININEKNIEISKTLRSEFHFLKYPFFNLCTNDTKRFIIKIEEREKTDEGEIETLWKVSRDVEADFPSSFARRIHKEVVEKILERKRSPSRLIKLGSLWEICKSIKLAPSGRSYIKIKKALEDIVKANITTKRTFKLKKDDGRMEFFDGTFHLYDGVYFLGQRLPDGTEADAVYVLLNDMYLQNFNNNFIVPLDYDYIHSLKGNIASRMYEILILWFYPTFINKRKYIEKKYSNLCDYFPLIKQDIKWKAKKQLSLAHQQHVANGFLESDPLWKDIGKKDDWLLRYYIGPRAEQWYCSIKKGLQPIEISEQKQIAEPTENKTEENPLLQKLLSLKIPLKKAEQLINNHNNIEDWIAALDMMKPKNRAGFLVAALTEGWELPDDFKKRRAERNQKKEEELKSKYFEHIFEQVDKLLAKKMNEAELEKEMELHKEEFLRKYPKYKQFENNTFLMPFVKDDYRRTMAVKLKLPSFEQWKEQRI